MRLILVLLISCSCFGQGMLLNPFSFSSGGASPTYLVKQDFEGAGYDNSETWTETSTIIDEDYTTSPAPLVGSQSCRLSGTTVRLQTPTFAGQDSLWFYFVINTTTTPAAGTSYITVVGPNWGIDRLSDGTVRVSGSFNGTPTITTMANGTTYHFLGRYVKGTGGNAVLSIEFNTTGTFTGSGNGFSQITNGTETQQVTAIRFHAESGTTVEYVLDKVRVDDATIGSSPP